MTASATSAITNPLRTRARAVPAVGGLPSAGARIDEQKQSYLGRTFATTARADAAIAATGVPVFRIGTVSATTINLEDDLNRPAYSAGASLKLSASVTRSASRSVMSASS